MKKLLNNLPWKLKGFWPYVPLQGRNMELGEEPMGITEWMNASVPGGVHHDLLEAGLIENPHYEMNSLKCEWVENRWWMYKTNFLAERNWRGKSLTLIFKGVDYKAHFILNGKKLGTHEGMYEPAVFDITDKIDFDGENQLLVLMENAPEEMAQVGYTSQTRTQKSRFNYKWDFSTRLVNIGIWDDVLIKATGKFTLNDTYISTELKDEKGIIHVSSQLKGVNGQVCDVIIHVEFDGEIVATKEEHVLFTGEEYGVDEQLYIQNAKLWYPNGSGAQPLYKVTIQLCHNTECSDDEEFYAGIRQIEYKRNEGSPEDSLPYTFVLNGRPVYVKGVNMVPLDLLYGNVSEETYENYFCLLKDANINLVRVWGGGIIEKDLFYHLCDVNGIMVWQEFIQSSSGIDNIPCTKPKFLELLKATAVQAVKTRRSYTCLVAWCGGNELMDAYGVPVTYENQNIKILKDIVQKYDPEKLFLPTSASGPNEFLSSDQPGKNHDVHGPWKYEGTEKHYSIYNNSDSLFHSEFGVDGMSEISSLKKFLSDENLCVTNMDENLVWRHHGEWWDTYKNRDKAIFGCFEKNELEGLIKCSQYMQAEGIRYAIEADRRRIWRNSGNILWQFNEPWPNVSCTNLVDYYGNKKLAYYFVKSAFRGISPSLKYSKFLYQKGDNFSAEAFVINEYDIAPFNVKCNIADLFGKTLYSEEFTVDAQENSCIRAGALKWAIPQDLSGGFIVTLTALANEKEYKSQYLLLIKDENGLADRNAVIKYYDSIKQF